MPSPEPRRSYRRYVALAYALVGDECRYYPHPHALCRTKGCECICHKWF